MNIDQFNLYDERRVPHADLGKAGSLMQLGLLEPLICKLYESYFAKGEFIEE